MIQRKTSIACVFLFIAIVLIAIPFLPGHHGSLDDLLLNLGPEILGIVVALAIVERMIERQRAKDESRRIAWRALHQLDHAVWVWQGGSRHFSFEELMSLLVLVQDTDPVPQFTQNLLLVVGSMAESTIRTSPEPTKASPALKNALRTLSQLAEMRDQQHLPPPTTIAAVLQQSAIGLADAAGLVPRGGPVNMGEMFATVKDSSVEAQRWRHYGDRPKEEKAG